MRAAHYRALAYLSRMRKIVRPVHPDARNEGSGLVYCVDYRCERDQDVTLIALDLIEWPGDDLRNHKLFDRK